MPVNDEHVYVSFARVLAETGEYRELFRPPLYPALLAAVFGLGGGLAAARFAQVVLATASVYLVHRLARREHGARVGLLAAGLVAFDPVLLGFSHLLWSETLFIFLLLLGLDRMLSDPDAERRLPWLGAGASLGLAALTRPQILTFLPFLLGWLVWRARRGERERAAVAGALLALATFACVLPWSLRNLHNTGSFVLVDTNAAYNLLVASEPSAAFVDKDDHWSLRWGLVEGTAYPRLSRAHPALAQRRALARSFQEIRAAPGRFATKSAWEAQHLWTLDSFVLRHLRNGWYGADVPTAVAVLAVPLCAGASLLLFVAGLLGIVAQPAAPLRAVSALALVHATLVFGLSYSLSRYAVPLRPLLACGAAWLLLHPGQLRTRFSAGRDGAMRGLIATAILAALVARWWLDLPLLADMLLHGGSAYRFTWLD